MLKRFLLKPLPFPDRAWIRWCIGLAVFLIVFCFLAVYQPFILSGFLKNRLEVSAGFSALAAVVVVLILQLGAWLAPDSCSREHFTNLGLVWLSAAALLLYALACYLLSRFLDPTGTPEIKYLNLILLFLDIVIAPTFLLANVVDWNHRKLTIVELPRLRQNSEKEPNQSKDKIRLLGNKGNILLELKESSFIAAFSNENYVDVFYLEDDNRVKKQMLRIPLSRLQDQVSSNRAFIRCHRTRLINLNFVTDLVTLNHKKLLKLKHLEEVIPVSRQYPIMDHFLINTDSRLHQPSGSGCTPGH